MDEGADILMVKPALAYLDVVRDLARELRPPARGLQRLGRVLDGQGRGRSGAGSTSGRVVLENWHAFRRAGADIIITYHGRAGAGVEGWL